MLILILGALDILAGLSIFFLGSAWGSQLVGIFVIYLFAKSLLSLKSIASIIDLLVAVVFAISLLWSPSPLMYIGAVWLIQKGIISFF